MNHNKIYIIGATHTAGACIDGSMDITRASLKYIFFLREAKYIFSLHYNASLGQASIITIY
jgi:hypothetical protein